MADDTTGSYILQVNEVLYVTLGFDIFTHFLRQIMSER